jgi:hypothetical protein
VSGGRHERIGVRTDDPQAEIRAVPSLFTQEGCKDRQAPQLGTFATRAAAEKHERAVQYFKRAK